MHATVIVLHFPIQISQANEEHRIFFFLYILFVLIKYESNEQRRTLRRMQYESGFFELRLENLQAVV